ncbi:hypothetical protein C1646_772097 [Rhizophagus diaphanus]|nr:hypothetical protein C1646_772097 [Rhizophagus diaphanus] [Rhizophagus sp. MUCL 43196]
MLKIFSGDLPELTEEIMQYFRKDFSTLYLCILLIDYDVAGATKINKNLWNNIILILAEIIVHSKPKFVTFFNHNPTLKYLRFYPDRIPLLWEEPFPKGDPLSREYLENNHFIEIYLGKLNEDVKTKLYEYGVNNNLVTSNTLFNYHSFIKYLDIGKILREASKLNL